MTRHKKSSISTLPAVAVEHFEIEALHQWDFVQRGAALMDVSLRSGDLDGFWFGLHETFSARGNISKIFFASRPKSQPRCEQMRDLLGVSGDSLLGDRDVRNALEHFDERVDTRAVTSKRHNFADRNVFAPGAIAGLDPGDFARSYDPTSATVSVFGEKVDLAALIAEARAIASACRFVSSSGTPPVSGRVRPAHDRGAPRRGSASLSVGGPAPPRAR